MGNTILLLLLFIFLSFLAPSASVGAEIAVKVKKQFLSKKVKKVYESVGPAEDVFLKLTGELNKPPKKFKVDKSTPLDLSTIEKAYLSYVSSNRFHPKARIFKHWDPKYFKKIKKLWGYEQVEKRIRSTLSTVDEIGIRSVIDYKGYKIVLAWYYGRKYTKHITAFRKVAGEWLATHAISYDPIYDVISKAWVSGEIDFLEELKKSEAKTQ